MEWVLVASSFKNIEGLFIDEQNRISTIAKRLSLFDPIEKGTLLMEIKKANLGFLTSCVTIMSFSKYSSQNLTQNSRTASILAAFYKITGLFLIIDSIFVKFRGFYSSGLINIANGAGTGVADFLGGMYFIHHGLAIENGELTEEKLKEKEKKIRLVVAGAAVAALFGFLFPEAGVASVVNQDLFPKTGKEILEGYGAKERIDALSSEYLRWKSLFDLYLIVFAIFTQRKRAGIVGMHTLIIKSMMDNYIQRKSHPNMFLLAIYLLSMKLQYVYTD